MEPGEFTLGNCNELISDERRRTLGDKARADAETGNYDPPSIDDISNYWCAVYKAHEYLFYKDAYDRRIKRLERIKNAK